MYTPPASTVSANVKGLMPPKKITPKAAPKPHVMQEGK